ncbi:MAG: hypothetical protein J5944_05375 [Lentisphaeria bacterium]|jgi:outer membrane lipopolysaccharide assembly protein LptE/RlpB|nr:hypothetical protein [Lentisphaeria bacterium]
MNSERSAAVLLFSLLLCLVLSGCGYHMGSMMHPQIKSIAISDIRNDTREPLLTATMRNQLAAAFQFDNSLALKEKDEADCILYCRIVSVDVRSIRESSTDADRTYRPSEFRITINAEFMVKIPGKSEPLIPLRPVSRAVNYQYNADPNVGKYYGMRQAAYDLSRLIVQYTTEAW